MYPSTPIPRDGSPTERRSTASDLDRDGFRPVALPALAAAVQAATSVKPVMRKPECAALAARFLHEDTPLV